MKKRVLVLMVVGIIALLLFLSPSNSNATTIMFEFDPNIIIDAYSTLPNGVGPSAPGATFGNEQHQSDPRMLYINNQNTWGGSARRTWTPQYTYYSDWQSQLVAGEGIKGFSLMFTSQPISGIPEFQEAQQWGQFLAGSVLEATADSGNGWNVALFDIPWHTGWKGVKYWTEDPANYLRPGGADIGIFTFTADVLLWDNAGENPPVYDNLDSEPWYGKYGTGSYNTVPQPSDYKLWFRAGDPLTSSETGIIDNLSNGGLEGTFMAKDDIVAPEPASLLLLGTGLVSLAIFRRKIGRKKFFN